jgi:hypothetical protein
MVLEKKELRKIFGNKGQEMIWDGGNYTGKSCLFIFILLPKGCPRHLSKHQAMQTSGVVDVWLHTLDNASAQVPTAVALRPRETPVRTG